MFQMYKAWSTVWCELVENQNQLITVAGPLLILHTLSSCVQTVHVSWIKGAKWSN